MGIGMHWATEAFRRHLRGEELLISDSPLLAASLFQLFKVLASNPHKEFEQVTLSSAWRREDPSLGVLKRSGKKTLEVCEH